ncbi:bestrophin family protein [Bordetella genomosp. 1]|uniref:Bestrophin n=1 Tax=Bordetella genomosp. 1 TaxID=1395607 RepID=A0ABX4F3W4_9BORD|nr:bestrophin family protein [Bordetella genomosp. 1]OZI68450.1 bestrophin [Bordetella genomosp. 1]
MIIRPRHTAFGLFFILRGSIIPNILSRLIFIVLWSCLVAWLYQAGHFVPGHLSSIPFFSLFGLALSVFMGFRNNVCYDRWWEARKQWGNLIVQARTLTRETVALADPELARRQGLRIVAMAHALVARLRDQDALDAARPWLPAQAQASLASCRNVPQALLAELTHDYIAAQRAGHYGEITCQGLLRSVRECGAIHAACERIKNTPTPFAYTLLLHRTAWLFCLLLPLGLVGALGALTPLAIAIVAYTFFGLDALGDQLEEPFGLDTNDLPLSALARQIEIDVRETLGDTDLPEPLLPQGYLLQ